MNRAAADVWGMATAIVSTLAEMVRLTNSAMQVWFIECGDAFASMVGLPPARGTLRWLATAEAAWPMVPDRIEVTGQFTNLPDGSDLARWSATPADWIEQGTSFYAETTTAATDGYLAPPTNMPERYHVGQVIPMADAKPSITVTCQYCGVGGQDPERGYCGQCGGPFPEMPRRLGSKPDAAPTLFVDYRRDDPQYAEITRDAAGRIKSLEIRPTALGHVIK